MLFVGAARNALGRIDWERSDCAAPSMVEGGPRFHERSPSYAAHHRGRVGSFEACSHASGTHPRQIAGVHPNSNLLGFLGTLNYPCYLLTACGCGLLPSGCAYPMLRLDYTSTEYAVQTMHGPRRNSDRSHLTLLFGLPLTFAGLY